MTTINVRIVGEASKAKTNTNELFPDIISRALKEAGVGYDQIGLMAIRPSVLLKGLPSSPARKIVVSSESEQEIIHLAQEALLHEDCPFALVVEMIGQTANAVVLKKPEYIPLDTEVKMENQIELPHGPGFTLISRVTKIDDGTVFTEFDYTGRERLDLSDHFPGKPIFPGALLLEAMAQTAIQCGQIHPGLNGQIFGLYGIDKCRFRRIVLPGETICCEAQIEKFGHGVGRVYTEAKVNGKLVAEAKIIFGILRDK